MHLYICGNLHLEDFSQCAFSFDFAFFHCNTLTVKLDASTLLAFPYLNTTSFNSGAV